MENGTMVLQANGAKAQQAQLVWYHAKGITNQK